VGWDGSTRAKVLKIWKDYVNAFKARLDKISLHQTVEFDFTADLTGTGNRSEGVIKQEAQISPRDRAMRRVKSCQLPRNSAETTYTTSPDQIDGMKLEI